MPDMLIKLYDLEDDSSFMATQKEQGIAFRQRIGTEDQIIVKLKPAGFLSYIATL